MGDGNKDNECWERAEDMDTACTFYKMSSSSPGSEVVVDASATMSSATIVWRNYTTSCATTLLIFAHSVSVNFKQDLFKLTMRFLFI